GRPVKFRSTCVKRYYRNNTQEAPVILERESLDESDPISGDVPNNPVTDDENTMTRPYLKNNKGLQPLKRGRGRPKGSRNKVHLIDNDDPDNFE
ncbi:hypothetical protein GcM3_196052, partial [Golovinomyces cichoracearum]